MTRWLESALQTPPRTSVLDDGASPSQAESELSTPWIATGAIAIAAVIGGVLLFSSLGGSPYELSRKAAPSNASSALEAAETQVAAIATDAGATGQVKCYYVDDSPVALVPTISVACGPLRFPRVGPVWLSSSAELIGGDEPQVMIGDGWSPGETPDILRMLVTRPDGDGLPDDLNGLDLARPTPDAPLLISGYAMANAPAVLDATRNSFEEFVAAESVAARLDGTSCWFEAAAELVSSLDGTASAVCGPMLLPSSTETEAYWTRTVLLLPSTFWSVEGRLGESSFAPSIKPGDVWSPSGAVLPAGNPKVPDPLPQAPGVRALLSESDTATMEFTPGAELPTPSGTLSLEGIAFPDRVRTGQNALIPADGERFVAVQASVFAPTAPFNFDDRPTISNVTVTLAVGDDREDLSSLLRFEDRVTSMFLLSVPEDAPNVDLVVTSYGRDQSLSLIDGSIRVEAGTSRAQTVAVNRTFERTLEFPRQVGTGSVTVNGELLRVHLRPWFSTSDGGSEWAPDGSLFARLDFNYWTTGIYSATARLSGDGIEVVLPDGSAVSALDGKNAFLVTADVTSIIVRIRPTITFHDVDTATSGYANPPLVAQTVSETAEEFKVTFE